MFGFDPEVPAGFQDADIEMLEMAAAADDADVCEDFTPLASSPTLCKRCGWNDSWHLFIKQ